MKTVYGSLPSRGRSGVLNVIVHCGSDGAHRPCLSSRLQFLGYWTTFPHFLVIFKKVLWRLQLYLWSSGCPENHPAWPHPPQGKRGYRHFLQSLFFWRHLELQRRQWEVNGGRTPGDRYWQHCTAIPEKLKQLRETGLSSLSFWATFHFLEVREASSLFWGFNRRLE